MKFSIVIFLFLITTTSFSQNETNVWYFGANAGVDFNSGTAVAITDGALVQDEGCSSICDPSSGDILFYTNGVNVYNANHQIMPNGTGLLGHQSSTQSAIILRNPGSDSLYTIFTNGTTSAFISDGFYYSEVDMSLNGGLGDVYSLNNPILSSTGEKICIVQHANQIDYWIIVIDADTEGFRSYLFNSTGLSSTSVSSFEGGITLLTSDPLADLGYMKSNFDGSQLVVAFWSLGEIRVFDFDNSSGIVSSPLLINIPFPFAYGVEFSPDGNLIYGTTAGATPQKVAQFNLNAGSTLDIINSEYILDSLNTNQRGAIQNAIGGNMYIANNGNSFLSVVSNPNIIGPGCNYNYQGLLLPSGTFSQLGLPTFRNNFLDEIFDLEEFLNIHDTVCIGDSIQLLNTHHSNPFWALESNPSDTIGGGNTITVSPLTPTSYLSFSDEDSVVFHYHIAIDQPFQIDLGEDICDTNGTLTLQLQETFKTYSWSDGSDSNLLEVDETGVYWVEVSQGFCTSRDSIFIQFERVAIQSDTIVECDSTLNLIAVDSNSISGSWTYLGPPGSIGLVDFSPDSLSKNIQVTVPVLGEYIFTYLSNCGDEAQQTVNFISVEPDLNIFTEQACNFEINLIAENPVQNGKWSVVSPEGESATIDNETAATTTATVTNYGKYTFTYTYDFCQASFSQTIDILSVAPIINKDTTLYICELNFDLEAEIIDQIKGWKVLEGPGIVTFSSFDNGSTSVDVTEYGNYSIEFEGCGGRDTIDVRFEKEKPSISSPEFVECGLQALLEVNFVGEIGNWSVEPANDENIKLDVQNDHQVIITSDKYGATSVMYTACDTTVSRDVVFLCSLEIPNVFTPNNDAYNTEFFIPRLDPTYYSKSQFKVFNRWGVEVYHNGQYGLHGSWWNGKTNNGAGEELSEGVYFYELNLYNKVKKEEENYKGTIHLFR